MKRTKRKLPHLCSGASDEEIVRCTKSHDAFDRLEAGVSEVIEDYSELVSITKPFQSTARIFTEINAHALFYPQDVQIADIREQA
jgi:hypothetical protein